MILDFVGFEMNLYWREGRQSCETFQIKNRGVVD